MMKTIFKEVPILLLFGLFAFQPIAAQSKRHEVKIGFGVGDDTHYNKIINDYKKAYQLEDVGESYDNFLADYNISIWAEYLYHFNNHLAVGGTAGYSKVDGCTYFTGAFSQAEEGNHKSIDLDTHTFFVMPSVKATWFNFTHVSLYSRGAAGLAHYQLTTENSQGIIPRDESRIKGIYQLSPVGVEVGGERVRFYSELGYGIEGVFSLGVTWQFGK